MKRLNKNVKDIAGISIYSAGAAIGVHALGGNTGGLEGATSMMPAIGTMAGVGQMTRMIKKMKW